MINVGTILLILCGVLAIADTFGFRPNWYGKAQGVTIKWWQHLVLKGYMLAVFIGYIFIAMAVIKLMISF